MPLYKQLNPWSVFLKTNLALSVFRSMETQTEVVDKLYSIQIEWVYIDSECIKSNV